jgi:hypothetical protein
MTAGMTIRGKTEKDEASGRTEGTATHENIYQRKKINKTMTDGRCYISYS